MDHLNRGVCTGSGGGPQWSMVCPAISGIVVESPRVLQVVALARRGGRPARRGGRQLSRQGTRTCSSALSPLLGVDVVNLQRA